MTSHSIHEKKYQSAMQIYKNDKDYPIRNKF